MNMIKTSTQADPLYVGQFISQSECQLLKNNFKTSFPNESTSVNIKRSVLLQLLNDENVSGLRFMYGLADMDDASSRAIILMPCNFNMQSGIPNVIFNKNGFFDHLGNILSLDQVCAKQLNHVLKLKQSYPEVAYTKIVRGSFMGKASLLNLLESVTDEYITYHFGYDAVNDIAFKTILQPVNGDDGSGGLDHGLICPPDTGCGEESFSTCVATYVANFFAANADGELNTLRSFRDMVLDQNINSSSIEKYYTISASIMEQLYKDSAKAEVAATLYHSFFKTSVAAILANDKQAAFNLFEECMQYLTDKYLYQ